MTVRDRQQGALNVFGPVIGAGLLAATGAIHLDLYLTGYRTVPTIGTLFLLQIIAAFVLALAVLAVSSRLVAGAGALLSAGTLGGYLLSIWFGLFGFREVWTVAGLVAGVIEVVGFLVLGAVALARAEGRDDALREPSETGARSWDTRQVRLGSLAVLTMAAGALLGSALATAPSAPVAAKGSRPELTVVQIGGAKVLANKAGLTLYLFVPDSSTKSVCYGTCAVYWPPVVGTPVAGPGVTGRLGTIKRSDGSLQATYDGHPLYTYIADTARGQARGNAINLNGGYWYEMTVSGKRIG
jgi:predicted lipoprotein with Yx(FWY)xxD motif